MKISASRAFLITALFTTVFSTFAHQHASAGAGVSEDEKPQPQNEWQVAATHQLIVKYNPGADLKGTLAPAGATRMQMLNSATGVALEYFRITSSDAHVLRLPSRVSLAEAEILAAQIEALPDVEYAEPDYIMFPAFVPNDPQYGSQWHYFEAYGVNLPEAWDFTFGSEDVRIAVLDTGITDHADLTGRWVGGYDFISDIPTANDGNGRDNDPHDPGNWITFAESTSGPFSGCPVTNSTWHGTHVAGTIGAAGNNSSGVAGVNWVSKIVPVRVLGKCGGFTSDIADGMRWAAGLSVSGVPANPNPARVLNLSLAGIGSCSSTYQNAINDVTAAGAVVVVAAGNNGANLNTTTIQPANCNGVITVAATDRGGDKAFSSNYGSTIEISAPGGETSPALQNGVFSTLNAGATSPGSDTYGFYSGTSMAAPHISGVISLMLSLDPSLTGTEILQILQDTARAFPAGSSCTASICGPGIADAGSALDALGIPVATPTSTATPIPPTATFTQTNTPIPPTATLTRTNTPLPPTSTFTPTTTPTRTHTPLPPTATPTNTSVPSTSSFTPTVTPTKTDTPLPPTATSTRTNTPVQPSATSTPTATHTQTVVPLSPTATPSGTNTPIPPKPGVPVLLAPQHGALLDTLTPMFDWNDSSPSAAYYQVQVSATSNFTLLVVDETNIYESQFISSTPLTPGVLYYWRVRAFNTLGETKGWSSVRNFKTPLGMPALNSPLAGELLVTDRPDFDWDDVPGATSYVIQISTTSDFKTYLVNGTVVSSAYNPPSDLPQPYKALYWRIAAKTKAVKGPYSEVRSFTTGNPPSAPALTSPANNALDTSYLQMFNWRDVTLPSPPGSTNFKHYQIQIDDDPGFSSPVVDTTTATGDITDSDFIPATYLPSNTRLYWRVRAFNTIGAEDHFSGWSAVRYFRTAMIPPALTSPSNMEILLNRRPMFDWNDVAGATGYKIVISKNPNLSNPIKSASTGSSSYTPAADLPANTLLYWRVQAIGLNGPSLWSTTWSFNTGNPPSVPVLSSPTNNALLTDYTPFLNWNNSVLPAGTTFGYYEIQIDDTPDFSSPVLAATTAPGDITDSDFTPAVDLPSNTKFYWRVKALNTASQNSAWSSARTFRTALTPPLLIAPANGSELDHLRPTFSWTDILEASNYTIQISTNPTFSNLLVNSTTVDPTYTPAKDLPGNKTLYWRVRANSFPGGNGPSAWSATFQFTTP